MWWRLRGGGGGGKKKLKKKKKTKKKFLTNKTKICGLFVVCFCLIVSARGEKRWGCRGGGGGGGGGG